MMERSIRKPGFRERDRRDGTASPRCDRRAIRSLRARVDDSAEALGWGRRKSEDGSSGDAATKVASEKSLMKTASETVPPYG